MITELRTPAEPLVRGLNLRGRPAGELRFGHVRTSLIAASHTTSERGHLKRYR
jgi:hypothetical protein